MASRAFVLAMPFLVGLLVTPPAHAESQRWRGSQPYPLHNAADNDNLEEVRRLIAQGADVNAEDDNGATALMVASAEGHSEIVSLLVSSDADVNATRSTGWTALASASTAGHGEIVNLLLSNGADVNATFDEGWTALIQASQNGHGRSSVCF